MDDVDDRSLKRRCYAAWVRGRMDFLRAEHTSSVVWDCITRDFLSFADWTGKECVRFLKGMRKRGELR